MKNHAQLERGYGKVTAGGWGLCSINRLWLIMLLFGMAPKMTLKVQAEEGRPGYKSLVFLSNHPRAGTVHHLSRAGV
jgi:hypothetical protein